MGRASGNRMQDISVLGLVASRLASVKNLPVQEHQLFADVFRSPRAHWPSFAASVLFHVFVIVVLLPLTSMLSDSEEEVWRRHARTFRPLEIQIPDRLYLSSTQVAIAPRPVVEKPKPVEKRRECPAHRRVEPEQGIRVLEDFAEVMGQLVLRNLVVRDAALVLVEGGVDEPVRAADGEGRGGGGAPGERQRERLAPSGELHGKDAVHECHGPRPGSGPLRR